MKKKIKLNLGCGDKYKPGYTNIDKYNVAVADKISDIEKLLFESNSVDLIEADQLIEHFDYIHCKYVLSEWFRVLKPGSQLIIETPDLEKTYKKFISEDINSQKITLQWIYGIDSNGYQHKAGFTFDLLEDLLQEIGFEEISRDQQKTHTYEYGLRIVCKKPIEYNENQIFACFRKNLKSKLEIQDSYILIPLEYWLKIIFDIYKINEKNKNILINIIISKTIICNPLIPLSFIEEVIKAGFLEHSEIHLQFNLLKKMVDNQIHTKFFTLWIKNNKSLGSVESDFNDFISKNQKLILEILKYPEDFDERLSYILSLEPEDIKIFDIDLVLQKAIQIFNKGLKFFHDKQYNEALNCFQKSRRLYPDNYLLFWNLARLGCSLEINEACIIKYYSNALKLALGKDSRDKLEIELNKIKDGEKQLIPIKPIIK